MVVCVGDKTGLAIAGLLTPAVGDQLYVVALLIVFAVNAEPGQIVVSALAVKLKLLVRPMVTGSTVTQVAPSVMLAW